MLNLPSELNYKIEQIYYQKWNSKKYSYSKIKRPNYAFLLVLKGTIDYIINDDIIKLKENDLIFLPSGSNYDVVFHTNNGSVEDLLINFCFSDDEKILLPRAPVYLFNDDKKIINQLAFQLYNEFEGQNNGYIVKSIFYQILYNVELLSTQKQDKDFKNMQLAKSLLSKNYECSINDIASELFMSRSSFQKKFRNCVGTTPSQYRILSKVEKAKRLLITTDMPIKDIAFSLNYYDIPYFYKQFFGVCNMTPNEYRNSFNEGKV